MCDANQLRLTKLRDILKVLDSSHMRFKNLKSQLFREVVVSVFINQCATVIEILGKAYSASMTISHTKKIILQYCEIGRSANSLIFVQCLVKYHHQSEQTYGK